jgi:hypothetical protein
MRKRECGRKNGMVGKKEEEKERKMNRGIEEGILG